jgi:hypothetical protein
LVVLEAPPTPPPPKPVHSDNVVTLTRSCRTKPPTPDIIIDDLCDYLIAA